jgi:hypothetical protein
MLYALPYCTSFFIQHGTPYPHTGTLRGGSKLERRLHQELAAASRSHRATVELLAELLLQQWSGPPTVAVTNLSFAVAVAGRIILILQLLPTLGLGGVAGSCLVINLRVPCIGFESILRVYDSLVKFSLSVLLFYLQHGSTGTDRCAREPN